MGLISGMVIGMVAGIALMAGWKQMMRYRGTKRVSKVFDKDIGQDKRLGVAKLPLNELVAEKAVERELRLLPALDMLKIKDKDRETLTIMVCNLCHFCGHRTLPNLPWINRRNKKDRGTPCTPLAHS